MRFACISKIFKRTAALLGLALIAGLAPGVAPVRAEDTSPRVGIILSDLPPARSKTYRALKEIAGDATGQVLEMTGAEMWSVDNARLERLKSAAARAGVAVQVLDEGWNKLLAPMAPGATMTEAQTQMMHQTMQSKAAMGVSMMALPNSKAMEYALTKGMNAPEAGATPATLVIPLNATTSVTARRTSIAKTSDGYIWHGVVEGTGEMVTLLWWPSGRLTGSVTHDGHMFELRPMGGGMHGVVEMAPGALPPEHAPMGKDMQERTHMREDPLVSKGDAGALRDHEDPKKGNVPPADGAPRRGDTRNFEDAPANGTPAAGSGKSITGAADEQIALLVPPPAPGAAAPAPITITLLVAYTKQAASHYSDITKDLIALAVEETNQSFRTSGVGNVQIKLVHTYETGYVESGSHFDHVFRFADKGDGYMEEVHKLRDKYHADISVLIVHDPQGCGLSAGVAPPADRAFAVVHHECAATMYSLAHEIGHLLGARHDLALDDSMAPFPFGHGFVHGHEWRTMMSYKDSCDGCPRLPIWSNPSVLVKGVPAGDEKANNARVILEHAATVAAFR